MNEPAVAEVGRRVDIMYSVMRSMREAVKFRSIKSMLEEK